MVITAESCSRSASIQRPKVAANWTMMEDGTSRILSTMRMVTCAANHPAARLSGSTSAKDAARKPALKWPAASVPTASRNRNSALASLSRLSPSSTAPMRAGSRTCRRIAVAAVASGGATIAPSATAAAQARSGSISRAATATATVVTPTQASTSSVIGAHAARRSRSEAS